MERGAAISPLYVGGSKSLENLIREARGEVALGGKEEEKKMQSENIYMDMRGSSCIPPTNDQLLRAEV